MRIRRHPSSEALASWLSTGESTRIGRHIDECETCMATLESLSHLDERTVAGLGQVMAAPANIEDRTVSGLERRMRNEDALFSFLDLFVVGWSATKVILDLEEGSDD